MPLAPTKHGSPRSNMLEPTLLSTALTHHVWQHNPSDFFGCQLIIRNDLQYFPQALQRS